MGFIVNKDELQGEHDYIDGVEVIERTDVPEDLPQSDVDVVTRGDDVGDDAYDSEAEESYEDDLEDDYDEPDGHGSKKLFIAVLVIAIIVAGIVGFFIGRGGFGAATGAGTAALVDDQLDDVVASYTYNGAKHDITAREAIESQYSLETVQSEDGTYAAPSAETLISFVRTAVLLDEVEARGIEVSDDEIAEYSENTYGTSDFATLATQYGVTEDQAERICRDNALIEKLYNQIVPASTISVPEQPAEPEDGDTSTRSKEYAEYIIELAGDEWDAEAGDWASTDGPYYLALSGTDFTADSASYEEAISAYYVAYQEYAEQGSKMSQAWTDFANSLFAQADIQIFGIYA